MRRNALGLVQGLDIAAKIRKQDTGVRKPAMDMANMQIVAEVRPSPLMCGARALSCMEPEPSHVWGPSHAIQMCAHLLSPLTHRPALPCPALPSISRTYSS